VCCLFSIRDAEKEFLEVPFQARQIVLDGIQPQTLKSDIELTAMSYQLVSTFLFCDSVVIVMAVFFVF